MTTQNPQSKCLVMDNNSKIVAIKDTMGEAQRVVWDVLEGVRRAQATTEGAGTPTPKLSILQGNVYPIELVNEIRLVGYMPTQTAAPAPVQAKPQPAPPAKRGPGRPKKRTRPSYSPEQKVAIIADAATMGIKAAARKHGCSPQSVLNFRAAAKGTTARFAPDPTVPSSVIVGN